MSLALQSDFWGALPHAAWGDRKLSERGQLGHPQRPLRRRRWRLQRRAFARGAMPSAGGKRRFGPRATQRCAAAGSEGATWVNGQGEDAKRPHGGLGSACGGYLKRTRGVHAAEASLVKWDKGNAYVVPVAGACWTSSLRLSFSPTTFSPGGGEGAHEIRSPDATLPPLGRKPHRHNARHVSDNRFRNRHGRLR